jgi:hypothetical protein
MNRLAAVLFKLVYEFDDQSSLDQTCKYFFETLHKTCENCCLLREIKTWFPSQPWPFCSPRIVDLTDSMTSLFGLEAALCGVVAFPGGKKFTCFALNKDDSGTASVETCFLRASIGWHFSSVTRDAFDLDMGSATEKEVCGMAERFGNDPFDVEAHDLSELEHALQRPAKMQGVEIHRIMARCSECNEMAVLLKIQTLLLCYRCVSSLFALKEEF